jgi:hypothetical protein
MNCSSSYDFLGAILWALILWEAHFIPKKIVAGPRVSVSNQNKKITAAGSLTKAIRDH